MKPAKFLSTAVALCGAIVINVTTALAAPPANPSALLNLEAKAKQTAAAKAALDKAEIFYTGKPYDADAQEYIFAARNYDPKTARWTATDPSGFPNGVNNGLYVSNNPVSMLDDMGLTGKSIAWVMVNTTYGTQSADQVAYALQINLNMVINDMKSQDQNGNTNYLSDGDSIGSTLIRSNDLSGAVNALSSYDRIVLYDHGFYDANTFTIFDGTTTHKTPSAVFGGLRELAWLKIELSEEEEDAGAVVFEVAEAACAGFERLDG